MRRCAPTWTGASSGGKRRIRIKTGRALMQCRSLIARASEPWSGRKPFSGASRFFPWRRPVFHSTRLTVPSPAAVPDANGPEVAPPSPAHRSICLAVPSPRPAPRAIRFAVGRPAPTGCSARRENGAWLETLEIRPRRQTRLGKSPRQKPTTAGAAMNRSKPLRPPPKHNCHRP